MVQGIQFGGNLRLPSKLGKISSTEDF